VRVLVGDIGGTHTRLALCRVADGRYEWEATERASSPEHGGLEELVADFRSRRGATPDAACFGVPGPVREGRARLTNLPWVVEERTLARAAGVPRAILLNDAEAKGWGIGTLGEDDVAVVKDGEEAAGNRALLAAGTGLGQSVLVWDGRLHRPFATEGGQAAFSPAGALQEALLAHLRERFGGHVSWERVLSGPGLVNLHDFLVQHRGLELDSGHREELDRTRPEVITRAAAQGTCPLCREAVTLFVTLYGSEAGNLALRTLSRGGVYLGGGIAPDLVEELRGEAFRQAFLAKGRMRGLLESIPVRVILDEHTALRGAVRRAIMGEA
jgi:glucokinase